MENTVKRNTNTPDSTSENQHIAQRLDFIGLTPEARKTLERNQDAIKRLLPEMLDTFYAHLEQWPQVNAMFKTPEIKKHARDQQEKHWARIASGNFNEDYLKSSLIIGNTHNRIGLEPKWYIGGYAVLTAGLMKAMIDELVSNPLRLHQQKNKTKDIIDALVRAVFLDMDLAVSTYMEAKDKDFSKFLDDLARTFNEEMGGLLDDMSSSSEAMVKTAENLSKLSQNGMQQSASMASATQEASASVESVAAAAEELSLTTKEINHQILRTSEIVGDAATQSRDATGKIDALKNAAEQINSVINLISDIAEQTNLLALNATIEAARAGEAGKGFAVVASEVKNLASQTARATGDIAESIKTIQESIVQTVSSIEAVAKTIQDVEQIASSVSAAVNEQDAATQEIVRSAQGSSDGVKELSMVATKVSDNATTTEQESLVVNRASRDVGTKTTELREKIDAFLKNIKKA